MQGMMGSLSSCLHQIDPPGQFIQSQGAEPPGLQSVPDGSFAHHDLQLPTSIP